jgi:hypothetical protein
MIAFRPVTFTLAVVAATSACDDDPLEPVPITEESILGTYVATQLDVTVAGSTMDLLDEGAEITITLADDGTTSGRLFVPEGNDDGSDLDASLDGTFVFDDDADEVSLNPGTENVLEGVTFTASREDGQIRLTGTRTFFGTRVDVTLAEQ